MKLWMKPQIRVEGKPNWLFIKLYTHGAPERNRRILLGAEMDRFFSDIEKTFNDGHRYRLHYVSTREMYNIARAAMDGKTGNAGDFRDYLLVPFWRDP